MKREHIYVVQDADGNQRFNGDEQLSEFLDEFNSYYETDYKTPEEFNEGENKAGREDRFILKF